MKKAWLIVPVIVVSFIIIIITMIMGIQSSSSSYSNNSSSNISITNSTGSVITLSELALHNSQTSCWVVYEGNVYDLTSWLPRHPGGINAILPYCGTTNFEQAFIRQHGNSKASLFMQVAVYIGEFTVQGVVQ